MANWRGRGRSAFFELEKASLEVSAVSKATEGPVTADDPMARDNYWKRVVAQGVADRSHRRWLTYVRCYPLVGTRLPPGYARAGRPDSTLKGGR